MLQGSLRILVSRSAARRNSVRWKVCNAASVTKAVAKSLSFSSSSFADEGKHKLSISIPYECHPQVDSIRQKAHGWFRTYYNHDMLESIDGPLLMASMLPLEDQDIVLDLAKLTLVLGFLETSKHSDREKVCAGISQILDEQVFEEDLDGYPLLQAFANLWLQIQSHVSETQQSRFVAGMNMHINGLYSRAILNRELYAGPPSLTEYSIIRRNLSGMYCFLALAESMIGIELERKVLMDASFRLLVKLATEHTIFLHDILLVRKDEGKVWGLPSILQEDRGCSLNEALAMACTMTEEKEQEFLLHLKQFHTPHKIAPFIELLKFFISGHAIWACSRQCYGYRHTILNQHDSTTVLFQHLP